MSPKALVTDFPGRFREIISDPLNVFIDRHPLAGQLTEDRNFVYLHNGNLVPCNGEYSYYGSFSDILIYNSGVHEPLEEFIFQELLEYTPDESIMLELGAYWGHYSMWLKQKIPSSRVVLVEADARNLEAGERNFARNKLVGEFIHGFVGNGGFSVSKFASNIKDGVINILHSDIQGSEDEMLEDCHDLLRKRRIDHLLVSTHSPALHWSVYSKLSSAGYWIEISSNFDDETTSQDGFIYASSPVIKPSFPGFHLIGRTKLSTMSGLDKAEYVSRIRAVTARRRSKSLARAALRKLSWILDPERRYGG